MDADDISWGSDFDEDDLDEDDVANAEFLDVSRFGAGALDRIDEDDDCRTGHYDLSQLNDKLADGEQLLNVGRFERIGTPPNGLLMDGELVHSAQRHYALHSANAMMTTTNAINGLARGGLEVNGDAACTGSMMYASNVSTSISSSGVSSVSGAGSNDASPSVSSYASACCSSSCNSSAADSTCSQSPPPPSTSSSTNSTPASSAKLACKLLAKLLTNSNGQLENEHLSAKNLQLKMQLNEQLNKQFNRINGQNGAVHSGSSSGGSPVAGHHPNTVGHNRPPIGREEFSPINKSTSMSIINHNNNYLKNHLEAYRPSEFKSSLMNKSMINLSQYNQLNDYQFKLDEHHLNDEIIAVKTNGHLHQRYKLNNSTSNLSTFKSTAKVSNNKGSLVARQIEQLNANAAGIHQQIVNSSSSQRLSSPPDPNDEGLSSGSSSILSTFKYSDSSDKSYQTAKGKKNFPF